MTLPLLVNALPAVSARRFTPEVGVWFVDVDLALDETEIVPFGPCTLTLGTKVLVGTVDPRASGKFGKSARIRILAGGGGWHRNVTPVHVHNPATVPSSLIYSMTAAEVGEVVVDTIPQPLGPDYVRFGGFPVIGPPAPASAVFGKREWHVSTEGITTVGPRVPLPYNPLTTDILSYDPLTRTIEFASDEPIEPGTIFVDPLRFTGPLIARDIDQSWSAEGGARGTAWCSEESGSRLQTALANVVAAKVGLPYLKTYRYRVVLQNVADGSLVLQAIDPVAGVPNAIPFPMWMGVPGVSATVTPGTEVLVQFTADTPPRPVVVGFKGGLDQLPILLTVGTGLGGPLALSVGVQAQLAAITAAIGAIATYIAAVTTAAATIPLFPAYAAAMAAPGGTVATALGGVAAAVLALTPQATSTLVVSD